MSASEREALLKIPEFHTLQGVLNGGVGQVGYSLSGERHHGGSRLVLRSLHGIPEKAMFQMSESKQNPVLAQNKIVTRCKKTNGSKMLLTCFDMHVTCL